MVRGFLWRIYFELANLIRLLLPRSGAVKYFAFGANMDPKILKQRRISPSLTEDFVLEDHKLCFSTPGPYEGMGFASVAPCPGAKTYGRLHTLSRLDAWRLDFYELVPIFGYYRRRWIRQGEQEFFVYEATKPRQGLKPTDTYLGKLVCGYQAATHVPEEAIAEIQGLEVITVRRLARDLQFAFPISERRLSPRVCRWLQAYDRRALGFFMKYVLKASLTERFIRV